MVRKISEFAVIPGDLADNPDRQGMKVSGFVAAPIAALVLMFAGNKIKGLNVKGFVPALIAAAVIGVISWFINGLIGLLF